MTTIPPPLWMQAVTGEAAIQYNAQTMRGLIDTIFSTQGVVGVMALGPSSGGAGTGPLAVSQHAAGANMTLDAAAGPCVITGTDASLQGKYLCPQPSGVVNVGPLTAAPPAGQERWDAIVAKVTDAQNVGGTTSLWTPTFVTGTPAAVGSAGKPVTPASALRLASIYVGPTVTQITNANIYDERMAAQTFEQPFGFDPNITSLGAGYGTYSGQPILRQHGLVDGTSDSFGDIVWNFPRPFPNGVLYATAPVTMDVSGNLYTSIAGGQGRTGIFHVYWRTFVENWGSPLTPKFALTNSHVNFPYTVVGF